MAKENIGKTLTSIKAEVVKEVFGEILPGKKYPEDFLSEKAKKELAIPIQYPDLIRLRPLGTSTRQAGPRAKRRRKLNPKNILQVQEAVKRFEETSTSSYEEILVPGEGKLKIGEMKKKVQVCLENGQAICEMDSLSKAKYLIYSRKKGQVIYKVPKSEIVVKKAVEAFEKDREKIIDKLTEAFERRNADEDLAHHLAMQVLEEIGLK